MTHDERAAMEWLEFVATGLGEPQSHKEQHARTLLAMLSEPRLPEEPASEIVTAMYRGYWDGQDRRNSEIWRSCYRALRAELMPKPATKTVEVWRVEYAEASPDGYIPGCETYDTKADAEASARNFRSASPAIECVRVTGPHKHFIPA